jgi:hypothetical protein
MPIDRANTPYDPSQNKPGATIRPLPRPTHEDPTALPEDHDDGPFRSYLNRYPPAPKPGIPPALLLWTVLGASITFATIVFFVTAFWRD